MIRQFVLTLCVALLITLERSAAWITSSTRVSMRMLPTAASSTQLLASTFDDDKNQESASLFSSSRRQWFRTISSAGVAAATAASVVCLPSNAADLPPNARSICDPTVSIWKNKDGRIVYLLGTAHISASSAELAGRLVQEIQPKGVFVELDMKRVRGTGILAKKVDLEAGGDDNASAAPSSRVIIPDIQLASTAAATASEGSSELVATSTAPSAAAAAPAKVAKPNPMMRAASAAVGTGIRNMYKKLDDSGFKAGEEFTVAIKEGQKIGSDIVLGDRDVEVTLRRLTEGLSQTDLSMLLNPDSELENSLKELLPENVASSSNQDLNDAEFRQEFTDFVEVMKTKDNVRKIMAQLQKVAPFLYEALVSERDAYMAAGLNGLNELETIVAVMGIAHVDGVEANLKMNGWKNLTPTCA